MIQHETHLERQAREWFERASYYAWSARHSHDFVGNDPLSGRPFEYQNAQIGRRLERASKIAMAREAFAIARQLREATR